MQVNLHIFGWRNQPVPLTPVLCRYLEFGSAKFDEHDGAGTGIVFEHPTPDGLRWALERAVDLYRRPEVWLR